MGDDLWSSLRAALGYCARREHLRRTLRIALVVGIVLTAINQLDVILGGDATTITFVKCGLNFVVPFHRLQPGAAEWKAQLVRVSVAARPAGPARRRAGRRRSPRFACAGQLA
jgi:hypothetical protein